ncbi:hypothetical protein Bca101_087748 [Brassica carinata]
MLEVVWTTEVFLIKWYSSSTNLKVNLLILDMYFCVFLKSSGLHGSLLTKSPFHNRSERFDPEDFSDDLPVSRLEVVWTSWKSSDKVVWTSCKVVWTSCKVVWKSYELPKSLLTKSSELPGSRLDFLEVVWTS